ncbi:AraC family transcriptional regulator [Methylobacterium crusticola]|uniref:AraC family transcriptional regulator n=1 Tax=Methylobacterium crusticola TaxID=1697972 RepID=UPI001FD5E251|nr:AraC family transcriptional regulator [Methylobacterium crusticola]
MDPKFIFQKAGISTQFWENFDVVPLTVLGRLTALAADHTRCSHFGLLVGQRATLASLGVIGALMRNSETVGDALRALVRHHGILNRGAVVEMLSGDHIVAVSYVPYEPDAEGAALHCERALAALTKVLWSLCGSDWTPEAVLLPRLQPPDTTPYTGFFRAPVQFEQETATLLLPSWLLTRSIEGAEPRVRTVVERRIRQIEDEYPPDLIDEIRRRMRTAGIRMWTNAKQVARQMEINRRTLSRRLKAEGTSFRLVASQLRLGIAKQLLADTNMSLALISAALEFSEPAAFTHAFRRWTGTTPSAWRKERRPDHATPGPSAAWGGSGVADR